jgi:hypothetical protein
VLSAIANLYGDDVTAVAIGHIFKKSVKPNAEDIEKAFAAGSNPGAVSLRILGSRITGQGNSLVFTHLHYILISVTHR